QKEHLRRQARRAVRDVCPDVLSGDRTRPGYGRGAPDKYVTRELLSKSTVHLSKGVAPSVVEWGNESDSAEPDEFAQASDELRSESLTRGDRKSTRLNSSHVSISYAVFCL